MGCRMGKPTFCIGKNKGADQLRSNCEADQRLCFRYTDSTDIPLLSKSKIYSLYPSSVVVQLGLCRTCSETTLLVFSRDGSRNGTYWASFLEREIFPQQQRELVTEPHVVTLQLPAQNTLKYTEYVLYF